MAELLIGTESGIDSLTGRVTALTDGWAIVDRSKLVQRTEPGAWHEWLTMPDQLTALTALGDAVFVGTRTGELARHRIGGATPHLTEVPGFDRVAGRDHWHAVGSSKPYVRSMSTSVDGMIYANVHVGGIPRSTDGGETWEPTIDVDADVHQVVAHAERPGVVVAAAAVGFAVSFDAGTNWEVHTDGLHGSYARAVAVTGDTVYLSASTGPFTHEGAVYRRALHGDGGFERITDLHDGNIDSGRLAASEDEVAFGAPDGHLYTSADGGAHWTVSADLAPVTALVYSRA